MKHQPRVIWAIERPEVYGDKLHYALWGNYRTKREAQHAAFNTQPDTSVYIKYMRQRVVKFIEVLP